jgi:hypothetical protein
MPDSKRAHRLMENTLTLAEFLEKRVKTYEAPQIKRKAIVQGHCHHKAIMRVYDDEAVMKKMGLDFRLLDSGCCGMAGSFGYEQDKYEVSVQCGERVLFPEVREAELSTLVMADGFSCREQIQQDTPRHALHLAEVMQMALRQGDASRQMYSEGSLVRRRIGARRRSMQRAAIITGLLVSAGVVLWKRLRRSRRLCWVAVVHQNVVRPQYQ